MAAYLRSCMTCHTASQTRPKRERTSIVRRHSRALLSFHHVKCQSVRVCLCVFVYVSVHKTCVWLCSTGDVHLCANVCFIHVFFCVHLFYPVVAPLTVACIRCQTPRDSACILGCFYVLDWYKMYVSCLFSGYLRVCQKQILCEMQNRPCGDFRLVFLRLRKSDWDRRRQWTHGNGWLKAARSPTCPLERKDSEYCS